MIPLTQKSKKTIRSVTWADQEGDSLASYWLFDDNVSPEIRRLQCSSRPSKVWRCRAPGSSQRLMRGLGAGSEGTSHTLPYKEALFRSSTHTNYSSLAKVLAREKRELLFRRSRGGGERVVHRCFASDHQVKDCRDPLRCWWCLRLGHPANRCRDASSYEISPGFAEGVRPADGRVQFPLGDVPKCHACQPHRVGLSGALSPRDDGE